MTNEEKAKELDNRFREAMYSPKVYYFSDCLLDMAQWKDEQFAAKKQALINKMDSILDAAEAIRETAIGRQQTVGWYWRKWAEWGYRKAMEAMEETK